MNWLDHVISTLSPTAGVKRAYARYALQQLNGYDAAGKGRRWFTGAGTSHNTESKRSLVDLRNASRELHRNNPYAAIASDVLTTNTIGTGITPSAKSANQRKKLLADALMKDWSQSVCDYNGQQTLFGVQALVMRSLCESGEGLVIRRIDDDPNLAVPLRLQCLESDFIDHTKDSSLLTVDNTVQGIQFSQGTPNVYWLHHQHPGDSGIHYRESKPVSADQVAHVFEQTRPGQVRGIPKGVCAYTRIKALDDFQDARVEQQKVAALFGGVIYSETGNEGKNDPLPERMFPGMLPKLNNDERIVFSHPPSVNAQSEFVEDEQRIIASAWGITYEALTGNYSRVNFASGKMARIQMYANIARLRRNTLIPLLCKKIETWFLQAAMLKGYELSGVSFEWTPPKKEILDIKNEIPAIIDEIRSGQNSLSNALRERGVSDPKAMLNELAEDMAYLDELGLTLDIDPRNISKAGQRQPEENNESDEITKR